MKKMKEFVAKLNSKQRILLGIGVVVVVLLVVAGILLIVLGSTSKGQSTNQKVNNNTNKAPGAFDMNDPSTYPHFNSSSNTPVSSPASYPITESSSANNIEYTSYPYIYQNVWNNPQSDTAPRQVSISFSPENNGYDSSNPTTIKNVTEKETKTYLNVDFASLNFVNGSCSLKTYSGESLVDSQNVLLDSNIKSIAVVVSPGDYVLEADCIGYGKEFTKSLIAHISSSPDSICDTKVFDITPAVKTNLQVNSALIGKWKGCTKNPWVKPFEVEFIFNADGTYSSRNIESETNPGTARTFPALYYGTDNDSPEKVYLINQTSQSNSTGTIDVFFYAGDVTHDEITKMTLNEDNTKLYFEVMHLGYGPIKFELEKEN